MRILSWKPTFRIFWNCCKSAPNGYSRNIFCLLRFYVPAIFYCWNLLTSEGEFQHLTLNIEALLDHWLSTNFLLSELPGIRFGANSPVFANSFEFTDKTLTDTISRSNDGVDIKSWIQDAYLVLETHFQNCLNLLWVCSKWLLEKYFLSFTVLCPSNLLLLNVSGLWRWVPASNFEYRGLSWRLSEHQLFFVREAWYQVCCKLTCFFSIHSNSLSASHWHYITFKRRGRNTKLKSVCVPCPGNLLSELFEFVVNLLQMATREIIFVFYGSMSKQFSMAEIFWPLKVSSSI
jgi:hypothetical protein